jgi:aspartokinase
MVTISHVVQKIIKENPSLEIALAKDLLSYSKLARYMHDEVEKELGRKVKDPAIIVALKRMREKAERMYEPKKAFTADEITTNSNLMEITVVRSPNVPRIIQEIYELDEVKKGSVVNITQGNKQTTFIFSEKIEKKVREMLHGERIISEIKDLSQISVLFGKEIFETPGFLVYVLKELSWNNINIIEIISTYTEFAIIVKSDDLMKAYGILRKVLF